MNYGNIKEELNKNIDFYSPGLLLRSIAMGGNYKNYLKKPEADIMIVQIPKSQLKKAASFSSINNIITQNNEGSLYLNPEYVKYSVRATTIYSDAPNTFKSLESCHVSKKQFSQDISQSYNREELNRNDNDSYSR